MASGIPCHKVILLGEYGVGKSSIFRRFVDNSFVCNTGQSSKMGLDNFSKNMKVDGCDVQVKLWDTAGIERFTIMSPSYYKDASAVIVCYAVNDRDSFNYVSQHVLDAVEQTTTAKIFLCGNKTDIVCDDPITKQDISNFVEQLDNVICETYMISCKLGEGVTEMFVNVAQILSRLVNEKFDLNRIKLSNKDTSDISKPSKQQGGCC